MSKADDRPPKRTPVPTANEACPIKAKLVDEIVARLDAEAAAAKGKAP
jgi:hypothetical protein